MGEQMPHNTCLRRWLGQSSQEMGFVLDRGEEEALFWKWKINVLFPVIKCSCDKCVLSSCCQTEFWYMIYKKRLRNSLMWLMKSQAGTAMQNTMTGARYGVQCLV